MMKYFKPELWEKINSDSVIEREQAKLEWKLNDQKYWRYFTEVEKHLPEEFLSIYKQNDLFHDYLLIDLEMTKKSSDNNGTVSVNLKITNGKERWLIQYSNVTRFHLDFVAEKEISFYAGNEIAAWDEWGYDEFTLTNNDQICHEILFSSSRTIQIHFKSVYLKKIID